MLRLAAVATLERKRRVSRHTTDRRHPMVTQRWLFGALVLILAMAGPLAPLTAVAQQSMQPAMAPDKGAEPSQGARVGAGFLNVVYVPGKAIICATGTVASGALMVLTLGSAYHDAVGIFNEGCSGKWVLRPQDVTGYQPSYEGQY